MSERIWDQVPHRARQAVFAAGRPLGGAKGGFGQAPRLPDHRRLLGLAGHEPAADPRSIETWPNSCGEESWDAGRGDRQGGRRLPCQGRSGDLHHRRRARGQVGHRKLGVEELPHGRGQQRRARARPRENLPDGKRDRLGDRAAAAGHRGAQAETPRLLRHAVALLPAAAGLRRVYVVGTTTSGCVRATVIDAFSNNFRRLGGDRRTGCFDRAAGRATPSTSPTCTPSTADVVPHRKGARPYRRPAGGAVSSCPRVLRLGCGP